MSPAIAHNDSATGARRKKKNQKNAKHYSDHSGQKIRLNRIRGQIEGIDRMIDERRYCVDIINQIRSAQSALKSLQCQILETHLRDCVKSAFDAKSAFDVDKKILEIIDLV